jgi:hypothetical protein
VQSGIVLHLARVMPQCPIRQLRVLQHDSDGLPGVQELTGQLPSLLVFTVPVPFTHWLALIQQLGVWLS